MKFFTKNAWLENLSKTLQIRFQSKLNGRSGNQLGNWFGGGWLAVGILAAAIGTASSADVPMMVVLKGQAFEQTGPTIVELSEKDDRDDDESLIFEAFAQGVALDSLVSATLQIPGGSAVSLVRESPTESEFQFQQKTENLLELNTSKPSGTYTFNLTTKNDGVKIVSVSLAGDTYPSVPQVTNFNTLQAAVHTSSITVQWSAMTGGTTNDFIMCNVFDSDTGDDVYRSGEPGDPNALDGTAVQAIIPTNTLLPGLTYEAEIMFIKGVDYDDTTYPGATAFSGYYKHVSFAIKTSALSGVALGAMFENSIPQPYTWDVARDSIVSFRFSHSMNPTYQSVTWTGVSPSNFTYEWTDGNKVLLCRYNVAFPANADIDWSLDLTGFRDAADFALSGDAVGSFHTSSETPESPPDVQGIYVVKVRSYSQTGASPVSDGMYGFDAEVQLSAYNRVKAATITILTNSRSKILNHMTWDPEMEVEATYASKTDLDQFFANGDFKFDLTTVDDGVKSVTLSMGTIDDYPTAPTVINLPALQMIDPAQPTTITWNALIGWSATPSTGSGMIELEFDNAQGYETHWADNEELTSGSQYVIPAGTLNPGRTYRVSLNFTKIKNLGETTYLGVMAGIGFSSVTEFTIQTIGNPVIPDFLIGLSGGGIDLNCTGGESNWYYVLEASREMQRWCPLTQTGGDNSYYDNDARYLSSRFYRLRDYAEGEATQMNRSIQGTVWTDQTQSTPVAGAMVGTSMDGQTIITDNNGSFFLETDTPNGSGVYTVSVTNGATQQDFGPFTGDQPREQNYWMSQSQDNVSIGGTVWTDTQNTTRVADAAVGTSLDGQTAVTDGNGNFFLQTDTPANYGSTPYTITIRVDSNTTNIGPHVWGNHPINQNLGLDGSF